MNLNEFLWVGGWVSQIVEDKVNSAQALAMNGTELGNIKDPILEEKYTHYFAVVCLR